MIMTEDKFRDAKNKCSIRKPMKFKHNEGRNKWMPSQYNEAHKRHNQTWWCEPTTRTYFEFWQCIVVAVVLAQAVRQTQATSELTWAKSQHSGPRGRETSRPAASKSTSSWHPASQPERFSWKQQENSISRCAKSWNMFVLSSPEVMRLSQRRRGSNILKTNHSRMEPSWQRVIVSVHNPPLCIWISKTPHIVTPTVIHLNPE